MGIDIQASLAIQVTAHVQSLEEIEKRTRNIMLIHTTLNYIWYNGGLFDFNRHPLPRHLCLRHRTT
jgi:hypothetical protein